MEEFDFSSASDRQRFERWMVAIIRNEVNSIVRQVLFERNATYIDTGNLTDSERIDRLEQAVYRR